MSAHGTGLIILCIIFSGAMLGMLAGRRLPPAHMTNEMRTAISVSMAVVGTMSALVLGLLISDASRTFSLQGEEVVGISADIIRMNQLLSRYGPQADAARDALRRYTVMRYNDLFPQGKDQKPNYKDPGAAELMQYVEDAVLALQPVDSRQRWLQARAVEVAGELSETRWLLVEQKSIAIPAPFLILIVFWLTLLFASFGLFAPRNITAAVSLFLCSLVVSSGIAVVLDMYTPFEGVLRLSGAPIRDAIDLLSR